MQEPNRKLLPYTIILDDLFNGQIRVSRKKVLRYLVWVITINYWVLCPLTFYFEPDKKIF